MSIIPRISNGNLVLPLHTLLLSYGAYVLIGVLVLTGTGLSIMTGLTMVPDEALLFTVLAIVGAAIGTFLVLYLCAFQERDTKVLNLKKKALETGVPVDEIELARINGFHNIYLVSMLLGIAITAALTYVVMISVMPDMVTLDSTAAYALWGAGASVFLALVLDRFFCHPIADGQFKKKVVDPMLDAAITKLQATGTEGKTQMTDEQKQKLVDFLTNL